MLSTANPVQSATIVARRSGPGFRLVLCLRSRTGTPVLETLADSFDTITSAERFATEQLGVPPTQIRMKAAVG
jgi:hypothetical protein